MSEEKKTSESEIPQSTTMDQLDNLEVANDFDDLNLEIVSEKPTANSLSDALEAESGPSIDEFVIAKEEHPAAEHHSSDQWYAEVLGQEIGPFPFEELVHLVANEEVGPEDKIRHTIQGEWMTAGDIAGLFPEIETDFELGGGAEFQGGELDGTDRSEAADSSDFQVVGGELNHFLADTRPKGSAPENIPEQETVQDAQGEQSDTTSEDSNTEEETEEAAEAKRKQEIAERLNAWLGDHVEEPVVETIQKKQSEQPVTAPTTSASISSPSPDSTTTYKPPVKPGPPPKAKKFKKAKQSREKIDLSGIAKLIDTKVMIAVAAVVVVGAIFVFMPNLLASTNDKKIYERYQEIYAQIQRARKSNPGQLATIAKEVVPELKDTVTALENAGAGAKKPAKQKLFFGGKYCLIPILEKKIAKPGKLDEKFKKYMEEVDGLLNK